MAMQDKKYKKFVKEQGITDISLVSERNFPEIEGVEDFTHIGKDALQLEGYSPKWAGRVDKSKLDELVNEVLNNQDCCYQTCYTNDAFQGYVPKFFSAIIKRHDFGTEVDCDVFGSRMMNYFGLPTVFNLRLDSTITEKDNIIRKCPYLISIDFIRENEEFYDLYDVYSGRNFDIENVFETGLERTIKVNSKLLKIFLDNHDINYSEDEIENFKRFLAKSIVVRSIFLGDKDFRNANAGILINNKTQSFRPAPNHDFNYLLKYEKIDGDGLKIVDEYSKLYSEDYAELFDRLLELINKSGGKTSLLEELSGKCFKDGYDKQKARSIIFNNIRKVADFELAKMEQLEK